MSNQDDILEMHRRGQRLIDEELERKGIKLEQRVESEFKIRVREVLSKPSR